MSKKLITSFVALTFVLYLVIPAVPVAKAVAIVDGDLIKTATSSAVYLIQGTTKRVFPHVNVYGSWGYPKWPGCVTGTETPGTCIKVVSATDLATYTDGNPVVFRDGSLFRGTTASLGGKAAEAVFYVEVAQLRPVKSAEIYQALFNDPNWAKVTWVPDDLLSKFNYPMGTNIESSATYPTGLLVKYGTQYGVTATGNTVRYFANDAAITANHYNKANAVTITTALTEGTQITGAESALLTVGWTTIAAAGLNASFVGPASGTVIAGQANAELAKFTLTNGGGAEIKVTTFKLKRIGVSSDTTLSKVYLYEGTKRLTDDAAVSSGVISWNDTAGIFTVAPNSLKTISVKANIATGTSGQNVGVSINAATDIVSNASAVNGTFPLTGNLMSIAATPSNMSTIAFNATTTPSAANIDPQEGFTAWQNSVNVGNRAIYVYSMQFRIVGSIVFSDLRNFQLYIDGVQIGQTVAQPDANGYVLFDASSAPKKVEAGVRVFKVNVDVVGGSGRNFYLSLRNAADISATDSELGVNVLATGTFPVGDATNNQQDINAGSLTISKATDSPSGNIVNNGSQVTVGKFQLKALGEKMKVENLRISIDSNDATDNQTFRNGALFVNGIQVGSTSGIYEKDNSGDTTCTTACTVFSLGSSLIVEPGTSKTLEIKVDVYDSEGTTNSVSAGDTWTARIEAGSSNVQRMTSGSYVPVPLVYVPGNVLTVTEGSLSAAKDQSYGNQSAVVPQTAYLMGKWSITAGTVEDVNLTTLTVALTVADEFAVGDLNNLYLKYGNKTTSVKGTGQSTQSWSISETLAKGASLPIEFYADIATSAVVTETTPDTCYGTLTVAGTTVQSATPASASAVGQTITAKLSGKLTVTLDSGTPVSTQVVAGSTPADGSLKVKLAATNEDLYVKTLTFRVDTNADDSAISTLSLYKKEGSGSYTLVSTLTYNNDGSTNPGYVTWNLTGTDRVKVIKNSNSYLWVKPTYVSSGQTAVSSLTPAIYLADLQAEGNAGVLHAQDTDGSDLVVEAGILIGGATPTFAADGTATAYTALGTTQTMTVNVAPTTDRTGSYILIDVNGDNTYDDGTDEIAYVMEGNTSDVTLKLQRGVLGTTTINDAAGNIFFLTGINGNAMTVLNTKATFALSSDSPSGATTGGTQKVVFKFNVAAANNPDDSAENKVTLDRVDITTTKSNATVLNLKLYPSEYDNNSTYVTTCVGLSQTKWRCTLNTAGSTNEIIENTSRTYVVRGDVGYSGAGSLEVSIAALGTSSTSTNDVSWTDDASTTQYWATTSTGSTYIQGGAQTTTAASGSADSTVPYLSTITFTDATADNKLDVGDSITLVFSEMIDPTTIASTLLPDGVNVAITNAATADISATNNTAGDGDDLIVIKNIISIDVGANTFVVGAATCANNANLAIDGKTLTLTVTTALTGAGADGTESVEAGSGGTTVKDLNNNAMTAAGSDGATVTGDDL